MLPALVKTCPWPMAEASEANAFQSAAPSPKTDGVEVEVGKPLDRDPQTRRQSLEERGRHIHVLLALVGDVLFGGEREDRAHVGREAHDAVTVTVNDGPSGRPLDTPCVIRAAPAICENEYV